MSETLLIATRKGLFVAARSPRGFRIARTAFLSDPVTMVLVDPRDGTWYAALEHGHFGAKLHRSTDRGETWAEIASPTYPARPDDWPAEDTVPWSTKLCWSLEAARDADGALWCGTIPGGLFRSDDRGDSWRLVESLWRHEARRKWFGGGADQPGIHSICVDPRDPRRVVLGVSCGGVWRSDDAGATWANRARGMRAAFMPPDQAYDVDIQDPHCVVQCAGAPDHYWAQHHNGVFKSTDDLASWVEIEERGAAPSLFGFAVAVHPEDPKTAWFVPAQKDEHRIPVGGALVVTRTRDGGESFEVQSQGLPGEHAYDLVYRHALAIAADGDTLAFGSTTGNVFCTEDGGKRWEVLSNYLPPVYAVRFA
jgi:photosystem II stability/assembly factor-like uncharacterized protein